MTNTFKAGTLLVDRASNRSFLIEETFTVTRNSEYRQLLEVGTLKLQTVKLDLSRISIDFEIVEPDPS